MKGVFKRPENQFGFSFLSKPSNRNQCVVPITVKP